MGGERWRHLHTADGLELDEVWDCVGRRGICCSRAMIAANEIVLNVLFCKRANLHQLEKCLMNGTGWRKWRECN